MGSLAHGEPNSHAISPALPPEWQRYRDGFAVLQHLASLTADGCMDAVDVHHLARDLGFSPDEAKEIVEYLGWNGYLEYRGSSLRICLTPHGKEYVRHHAGRRRSARPAEFRPHLASAVLPMRTSQWGRRTSRGVGGVFHQFQAIEPPLTGSLPSRRQWMDRVRGRGIEQFGRVKRWTQVGTYLGSMLRILRSPRSLLPTCSSPA